MVVTDDNIEISSNSSGEATTHVTGVTRCHGCCPHCGHPYSGEVANVLPKMQRRLFEIVNNAGADGIRGDEVMNMLYYDDPTGGPESNNIVSVMVTRGVNPKISKFGLKIVGRRGPNGYYKLVRT